MASIVVEYEYDPPLTAEVMGAAFERLKPCLEVRSIRRLRSWVSDDGTRGFCEFEGPDLQTLRDAYQSAKVRFVRLWAGKLYEFNPPTR